MSNISILGSTGSIGKQTQEVINETADTMHHKVVGLAAYSDVSTMEYQARKYMPKCICMYEENAANELAARIADLDIKVVSQMDGLIKLATLPEADTVLTAVVGMIGIRPTLAAINEGKRIALANKETLVTAGHLVTAAAQKNSVSIYPVDSEHSAIFQCLQGNTGNTVDKIYLTCSGGPFRGLKKNDMACKTAADALKHPNWNMGRKITIDSATLVNKGLEVMEARWLFGVGFDKIQVVIQPGSVIHSMVQYEDGAIMAQLGTPDMKIPIQYALNYPNRLPLKGERLDFSKLSEIKFETPDTDNFPALKLAYDAGKIGGTMPTVFNAANEWAVARFLDNKIGFLDITNDIEKAMSKHKVVNEPNLEEILEAEAETYDFLNRL